MIHYIYIYPCAAAFSDKQKLFQAPEAATTVLEALEQRLEKYQGTAQAAKEDGNSSKARRMSRIVKQYQDAIKTYKAHKPVDYDDLPCPPGNHCVHCILWIVSALLNVSNGTSVLQIRVRNLLRNLPGRRGW